MDRFLKNGCLKLILCKAEDEETRRCDDEATDTLVTPNLKG